MIFDLVNYQTDHLIEAIHFIEKAEPVLRLPNVKAMTFEQVQKIPEVKARQKYLLTLFEKKQYCGGNSPSVLYGLVNLKCQEVTQRSAIEFLKESEERQKLFTLIYYPTFNVGPFEITEATKQQLPDFIAFFSETFAKDSHNITDCFRKAYPLCQPLTKNERASSLSDDHLLCTLINQSPDLKTLFELKLISEDHAGIEIKLAQRAMLLINQNERVLCADLNEAREFLNLLKTNERFVGLFKDIFEHRKTTIKLNLKEEKNVDPIVKLDVCSVLRFAGISNFFQVLFSSKNFQEKEQEVMDIRIDFHTYTLLEKMSHHHWALDDSDPLEVYMTADRFSFEPIKSRISDVYISQFSVGTLLDLLLDERIELYDNLWQKCLQRITNPYYFIYGLENLAKMLQICEDYEIDNARYVKSIKDIYINKPIMLSRALAKCPDEGRREKMRNAVLSVQPNFKFP